MKTYRKQLLFFIVDATEKEVEDLKLAHGNYINCVDDVQIENAINRVSLRIGSPSQDFRDMAIEVGLSIDEIGKWEYAEADITAPLVIADENIEMIIITGWVM